MLSHLDSCLRHAINASPNPAAVNTKLLLANVRNQTIPPADYDVIGRSIEKLPIVRIDDLLWTLFGMYIDPRSGVNLRTNIQGLAVYVWNCSTENIRFNIGAKFGLYRNNADIPRKDATLEFLQFAGGLTYRDDDSLAAELIEKLGTLKTTHFAMNNFYNEAPIARTLKDSLPQNGRFPRAARPLLVRVITLCFIGNGFGSRGGVDQSALPIYQRLIESFSEPEYLEFIKLFADAEWTSAIWNQMTFTRAHALARYFKDRAENIHVGRALEVILGTTEITMGNVANTAGYKHAVSLLPNLTS